MVKKKINKKNRWCVFCVCVSGKKKKPGGCFGGWCLCTNREKKPVGRSGCVGVGFIVNKKKKTLVAGGPWVVVVWGGGCWCRVGSGLSVGKEKKKTLWVVGWWFSCVRGCAPGKPKHTKKHPWRVVVGVCGVVWLACWWAAVGVCAWENKKKKNPGAGVGAPVGWSWEKKKNPFGVWLWCRMWCSRGKNKKKNPCGW